jgi:2-amino-4-hydroxy-6-hydroxymethyldihydropteridine diphosphokinase
MAIVYIGMGSNMNNPKQQLVQAKKSLQQLSQVQFLNCSDLFQSKAMTLPDDNQPQDDYINAVVKLNTQLTPHQLLDECQKIENKQGRVREKRWGARTLDLDVLLYDDLEMKDERLSIPHPGIAERDFVLYPLCQIDKNMMIPGQGECYTLKQKVSNENIQCLGVFA